MQYTAEEVKEYLKNYHIYCGKVLCKTANERTVQAMERLKFALFLVRFEDRDLIERYYKDKDCSLSELAKIFGCSKNNIAKKLNCAIAKLAQVMSDDDPSEMVSATCGSAKYTEKQIRAYLKRIRYFMGMTKQGIELDDNYIRDMQLLRDAVNSLEDMDKQLVSELYENKEKLSVIGNTYGYSVSGVKYRINVAIKKICAIMNGDI